MAITDYIDSLQIGTDVANRSGSTQDGLVASGYSVFVRSVTGAPPTLVSLSPTRSRLVVTKEQALALQKFLDKQVAAAVSKPVAPPMLELELGPVVGPWVLKYAIPFALLLVVLGWVAHWYFSR